MRGFTGLVLGSLVIVASAATPTSSASSAPAPSSNTTCAQSLYILVARGSGEAIVPPGAVKYPDYTGLAGVLALNISSQIPGSVIGGVVYPALEPVVTNLTTYYESEGNGTSAIADEVAAYTKKCPGVKIALMGYSQGAQVVQDALCGGLGTDGFNDDPPMPASLVENNADTLGSVIAVALIADPSHIANTTYDHGNSTHNGVFARTNTTACDPYVARGLYGSWCQANDIFCDSGNSTTIHTYEPLTYEDQIVQFVVDKWNNYTKEASSSPSGTGSPSGTATGTATTASGTNAAGRLLGQGSSQSLLVGASVALVSWLL
ncbi:hypothetical protein SEUCBS140593_010718 [Sporothrix eucalyptigena]|uniref:Carbohydrate esterase family 5 protein n=1 Tax=Sporothrix eucalyptigena TaxID=1812306 RepID=A0ABP0D224_9PEZI